MFGRRKSYAVIFQLGVKSISKPDAVVACGIFFFFSNELPKKINAFGLPVIQTRGNSSKTYSPHRDHTWIMSYSLEKLLKL